MGRRLLGWLTVLCLGLQAALLLVGPFVSTDTFRYIHEGRAQRSGLATPYRAAPRELSGVRTPWPDDGTSARVEHRDVPAAYLPGAELLLLGTTAVGDAIGAPLLPLRVLLLGGVVAVVAWLWRRAFETRQRLEHQGSKTRHLDLKQQSFAWGALLIAGQPLVLFESGLEAHLDGAALPLLAVVVGGGSLLAGLALGLLVHVKPVALLLLPLLPARARVVALAAAVVVAVPHLLAGVVVPPGLLAYGTRWRAHPIGFALLEAPFALALPEGVYVHAHVSSRGLLVEAAGVPVVALGDAVVVDQPVLLDPTLGGKVVAFVAAVVVVVQVRRRWPATDLAGGVGIVLLTWLLLTPTLHPWYGLWLVVPAALTSSRALRRGLWTFAALLPLLHQSDFARAATGVWHEALWPRVVVVAGAVLAWLSGWRFIKGAQAHDQEAGAAQPEKGRDPRSR